MGINLGIIPARGESKGIPKKNIRKLAGKPLIAYSIESARESNLDRVIVSTDDKEIATLSQDYDCEVVIRPKELATDTSPTEDALIHAVQVMEEEGVEIDTVVLLQPTSVLRTNEDINNALDKFKKEKADSLLSVFRSHYFIWKQRENGKGAEPINYDPHSRPMRQQMNQYVENGAIYITKKDNLITEKSRLGGKIALYEMEQERSLEIDTEEDWWMAETLFEAKEREYLIDSNE